MSSLPLDTLSHLTPVETSANSAQLRVDEGRKTKSFQHHLDSTNSSNDGSLTADDKAPADRIEVEQNEKRANEPIRSVSKSDENDSEDDESNETIGSTVNAATEHAASDTDCAEDFADTNLTKKNTQADPLSDRTNPLVVATDDMDQLTPTAATLPSDLSASAEEVAIVESVNDRQSSANHQQQVLEHATKEKVMAEPTRFVATSSGESGEANVPSTPASSERAASRSTKLVIADVESLATVNAQTEMGTSTDESTDQDETNRSPSEPDKMIGDKTKPNASEQTVSSSSSTSRASANRQALPQGSVSSNQSLSGPQQARFLQRVTKAFEVAQQRGEPIRIRLHPSELGAMRLEIKVDGNVLLARIEAETQSARSILIDNLPVLRERLEEQDIQIKQFDVDVLDRQSPETDQQQEHQSDHESADGGDETSARQLETPPTETSPISATSPGTDRNLDVHV